jgi:2-C-methyl-D-erythritol 4-phosphate cytidylyltransferase
VATTTLVIPAAGRGTRYGGGIPKQFLPLAGVSVLARSLRAFSGLVDEAVLAVASGAEAEVARCVAEAAVPFAVRTVAGGDTRMRSVAAAIAAARGEVVLVHDAVRPLVPRACITACLAAIGTHGAALVAVPCSATVKRASGERVAETVPRDQLWLAQTPQGFRRDLATAAFDRAIAEAWDCSDDAQVLERAGHSVGLVPGDARNLKITTPEDLALAAALIASSSAA